EREPRRRRARRSMDVGSVAAGLKTFFGSAAAVKTAATVAVVTSATVVAVAPAPRQHHTPRPGARVHKRHVARVTPGTTPAASAPASLGAAPVAVHAVTPPPAAPVRHVVVRRHRPPAPVARRPVVSHHVPVAPRPVAPPAPPAAPAPPAPTPVAA